jgi:hypothetical protein
MSLALVSWPSMVTAKAGPPGPAIGDTVTITMAGRTWCATVNEVDTGVDGSPWAWVTINADTRRVFHWPVGEMTAECWPQDTAGFEKR